MDGAKSVNPETESDLKTNHVFKFNMGSWSINHARQSYIKFQ